MKALLRRQEKTLEEIEKMTIGEGVLYYFDFFMVAIFFLAFFLAMAFSKPRVQGLNDPEVMKYESHVVRAQCHRRKSSDDMYVWDANDVRHIVLGLKCKNMDVPSLKGRELIGYYRAYGRHFPEGRVELHIGADSYQTLQAKKDKYSSGVVFFGIGFWIILSTVYLSFKKGKDMKAKRAMQG